MIVAVPLPERLQGAASDLSRRADHRAGTEAHGRDQQQSENGESALKGVSHRASASRSRSNDEPSLTPGSPPVNLGGEFEPSITWAPTYTPGSNQSEFER